MDPEPGGPKTRGSGGSGSGFGSGSATLIPAICAAAFRVCFSLVGVGQGSSGENPTQGCWYGTGTELTFPRGKETPCGYGSNFQDCEGN